METESKIVTLFEFTQRGYEETQQQLEKLIDTQKKLVSEQSTLQKVLEDSDKELSKLSKTYSNFNKTLTAASGKEAREAFEATKKQIVDLEAATKKYEKELNSLSQQQAKTTKQIKDTEDVAANYKKVMAELSKGMDNAKTSMQNLSSAQKYLQDQLNKTELGTPKYTKLSQELAKVSTTINTLRRNQRQQAKEMEAEAGSVEALRLKVSSLKNEWKSLNQNSPEFAKVRDELKATTEELNKAEQAVGIFSRNVGNYASAFEGLEGNLSALSPGLSGAVSGFKQLLSAAKAFIATPIGIVLTGIVVAFKALKAAFTSSAEGQEKYNKLLGTLTGIVTVLKDTFAEFGEYLISIFEEPQEAYKKFKRYVLDPLTFQFKVLYNGAMGVGHAIAGIFSEESREKSKEYFNQIKQDFNDLKQTALDVWDGITSKVEQARQKAREGLDIANMENELVRKRLATTQELAENEIKISSLRSKAEERDRKSIEQQLKAIDQLQEAQKLIERNAQIRVDLATREYEIQKAKNALGKSTQEDLQKEADLRAAMVQVQREAVEQQKEILAQIVEIKTSNQDAYKTLLTEVIAGEKNIASTRAQIRDLENKKAEQAEIEVAQRSLAAYEANLQAKQDLLKKYTDANVKLSQKEQDDIELAQLIGAKEIEDIRKAANETAIATYNNLVNNVRAAQQKIIDAQKKGDEEAINLYTQLLEVRKAKLDQFNTEQLEYNQEQEEERRQAELEYWTQQEEAYVASRQKLYELTVQYNNEENIAQKAKLAEQIRNEREALSSITQIVEAHGTNIEELWEREKIYVEDASEFTADRIAQAIDQMKELGDSTANIFLKSSKSIVKSVGKVLDFKKLLKDGQLSLGQFKQKVTEVALQTVSEGIDMATTLISTSLQRQKEAIEEFAAFEQEQAERRYNNRLEALNKSLQQGEITEARYRIEQIKAQDEQADKEKEIERQKANQLYSIEMKQFRMEKAADLAKAGINIALGITAALSTGLPGIVVVPVISALGAAQIAAISARKGPEKPKYEKGGIVPFMEIQGPSHKEGGVPVSIGGHEVAEVEGGEGALIISKKAMKNKQIRTLLAMLKGANEEISGTSEGPEFEDGGYLTYDDFFEKAKASLQIKRKRRKLWVNGKKYKLPNKGRGIAQDQIVNDVAEEIATKEFEAYRKAELAKLEAKEAQMMAAQNAKVRDNEILREMGISDFAQFTATQTEKEQRAQELQTMISAYKELADARLEDLKDRMQYDEKINEFKERSAAIDEELETTTLNFNKKILDEMLEAGEISAEEHASYIDQITHGYGASTQEIINLKKKQVEATKALIEQEREAELAAAQEVADFRTQALEQLREEWTENYQATTEEILSDLSSANKAASELTGADLERFQEMVKMSNRVKEIEEEKLAINEKSAKLTQKYADLELELNDGIILSREEQLALQEEQKRIQEEQARLEEELKAKEEERAAQEEAIESAKDAFQEQRENSMEEALKAYEMNNFDDLLAKIKELGAQLQEEEANNWTLEKQLSKELDEKLKAINQTYDDQIAAQDAIIEGYNKELEQAELLHDKKAAYLAEEQTAWEENFEKQKAIIEEEYNNTVAGLNKELADLNSILANLKVAGVQIGADAFQNAIDELTQQVESLPQKYATGGVIATGEGVYTATGASHANGGIPVTVGGTPIAEIEGGEKLFAVNKFASSDPRVLDALREISTVNASYSGVPLIGDVQSTPFEIDYQTLAYYIGQEINNRPLHTFITDNEISLVGKIEAAKKTASMMK